jgi:hypothetical protein
MAILDAGAIIAAIRSAQPIRKVEVPEWGGEVYVAGFTLTNREWYLARVRAIDGDPDRAATLAQETLARQLVNESGTPIFDSKEAPMLGAMTPKTAGMLFATVLELSGLARDAVQDAEKNSASDPSSASSSASLSASG